MSSTSYPAPSTQKQTVKAIGAAVQLSDITRSYTQGGNVLQVLRGVNLYVRPGEMVALVGPSGSGKSTLLQITGLLDNPTSGEVAVAGQRLTGADDAARTDARRKSIGFVYQFHHLLPEFSARENVVLPQLIAGVPQRKAVQKADQLLEAMGVGTRALHRPAKLSGGEQQRVAIARALANDPVLLLADEPTGNLDPHTAEEVFHYLRALVAKRKLAALVATHNLDLASRMDRVVRLEEGRVVEAAP